MSTYRIAVTGEYARADGSTAFGDIGLSRLTEAGAEWEVIPVPDPVIDGGTVADFDALFVLGPKSVTAETLRSAPRVRHVARFGAGYDAIDVGALSAAGVLLTHTPAAVRRPMVQATLAMLFATTHNLVAKDHSVRAGDWSARERWRGRGLDRSKIGLVGLGGIGGDVARALVALGLDVQAYNRTPRPELVAKIGIEQVALAQLMRTSDVVIVLVSANSGTRRLIDGDLLRSMPAGSTFVNMARGAVVDESALIEQLRSGAIASAGLDVFEYEPLPVSNPLVGMPNVVLSPHSLCWTDDFAAAVSDSAIAALLDVKEGRVPEHVVNPEVLALRERRTGSRNSARTTEGNER